MVRQAARMSGLSGVMQPDWVARRGDRGRRPHRRQAINEEGLLLAKRRGSTPRAAYRGMHDDDLERHRERSRTNSTSTSSSPAPAAPPESALCCTRASPTRAANTATARCCWCRRSQGRTGRAKPRADRIIVGRDDRLPVRPRGPDAARIRCRQPVSGRAERRCGNPRRHAADRRGAAVRPARPAALVAPRNVGFTDGPSLRSGQLPAVRVVGQTPSPEEHIARVRKLVDADRGRHGREGGGGQVGAPGGVDTYRPRGAAHATDGAPTRARTGSSSTFRGRRHRGRSSSAPAPSCCSPGAADG